MFRHDLSFLTKKYLFHRNQRTKVESSYSDWFEFVCGNPQGSILGPLFFNIFINDIFSEIQESNICNFADDNTLYSCSQDLQTVIENLTYMKNVLTWFKMNSMKANPRKFQFMFLSKTRRPEYNLLIDSNVIKEPKLSPKKLIAKYAKQRHTNFMHSAK